MKYISHKLTDKNDGLFPPFSYNIVLKIKLKKKNEENQIPSHPPQKSKKNQELQTVPFHH